MARLYLKIYRLWRRSRLVSQALFNGFWLGVLSRQSFEAIDEQMYNAAQSYRSDEHNSRGLFDWEKQVILEYFKDHQRVLLVGAGGGREVLALERMGHTVEAYECNPALLEYGRDFLRRNNVQAPLNLSSRANEIPATETPFDAIVIGWGAYMLIAGRKQRVEFLQRLAASLKEGSPILLSFFSRSENDGLLKATRKVANVLGLLLRRPRLELGDDLSPNYVHRFTEAELAAELSEAGFSMLVYQSQGHGPHDSGYAVGRFKVHSEVTPGGSR